MTDVVDEANDIVQKVEAPRQKYPFFWSEPQTNVSKTDFLVYLSEHAACFTAGEHENLKQERRLKHSLMDSQLYWCKQTNHQSQGEHRHGVGSNLTAQTRCTNWQLNRKVGVAAISVDVPQPQHHAIITSQGSQRSNHRKYKYANTNAHFILKVQNIQA